MNIVIYIYNGLTALDAIGPYEVLSRLPNANVKFVANQKGTIVTDTHFLKLVADYDLSEIDQADILIIPGSVVGFMREAKDKHLINWIKKIYQTSTYLVSVCTGSIILAAAGLLKNKQATSHWAAINLLKDYGAIATNQRYVEDGNIITAQGVSAGIDVGLYLAGKIAGEEQAKALQLFIEYNPHPPFNTGSINLANEETIKLAKKTLTLQAKKDLSLLDALKNIPSLIKLTRGK